MSGVEQSAQRTVHYAQPVSDVRAQEPVMPVESTLDGA